MADYLELSSQINMGLAQSSRTNDQTDLYVASSQKFVYRYTANSDNAILSFDPWNWNTANPSTFHHATVSQLLNDGSRDRWDLVDYRVYQDQSTYEYYRTLYYARFRASQAQVQAAYSALTNHGQVSQFNNRVWNDIVDKAAEMQIKWGEDSNSLNRLAVRGTYSGCPYITEADRGWFYDPISGRDKMNWGRSLMACKFNLVVNALEALPGGWQWSWQRDGIQTIVAGTPVKGDYILDLVRAINHFATLQKIVVGPFSLNLISHSLNSGLELWDYFVVQKSMDLAEYHTITVPTELWSIIPFEPLLPATFDIPNLPIPLLEWVDTGNIIFTSMDRFTVNTEVWDRIALWPQDIALLDNHGLVFPSGVPIFDAFPTQMLLDNNQHTIIAPTQEFESQNTSINLTLCELTFEAEINFGNSLNFDLVMIIDHRTVANTSVYDARVLNTLELSTEIVYNIFIEFAEDCFVNSPNNELGFEYTSILSFGEFLSQYASKHLSMTSSGHIVLSELQNVYAKEHNMSMLSTAMLDFIGKFDQYFRDKLGFNTSSNIDTAEVFEQHGATEDIPLETRSTLGFAEMLNQYSPNNAWSLKNTSKLGFSEMYNQYSRQDYSLNTSARLMFSEYLAQYGECTMSLEYMANLILDELVAIHSQEMLSLKTRNLLSTLEAINFESSEAIDFNYESRAVVMDSAPVKSYSSFEEMFRSTANVGTSKTVRSRESFGTHYVDKVRIATVIVVRGSTLFDTRFFGAPIVRTTIPVKSRQQLSDNLVTSAKSRVATSRPIYSDTNIIQFRPRPFVQQGESKPVYHNPNLPYGRGSMQFSTCAVLPDKANPLTIQPGSTRFKYSSLAKLVLQEQGVLDTDTPIVSSARAGLGTASTQTLQATAPIVSGSTASAEIVQLIDIAAISSIVSGVNAELDYQSRGLQATVHIQSGHSANITGFVALKATEQIRTGSDSHISGESQLEAVLGVNTESVARINAYKDLEVEQSVQSTSTAELNIKESEVELTATQQIITAASAELDYQAYIDIAVSTAIVTTTTGEIETETPSAWEYPIPMGDNILYIRQVYTTVQGGSVLSLDVNEVTVFEGTDTITGEMTVELKSVINMSATASQAVFTTTTLELIDGANWEYPVLDDENLTVTQAYTRYKFGERLGIT